MNKHEFCFYHFNSFTRLWHKRCKKGIGQAVSLMSQMIYVK